MFKSKYKVKYIEDNLIFTEDNEVWAYYEMDGYNYGFLSMDKKTIISEDISRLIGQNRTSNIHFLQVATESNFRHTQEKAKQQVTGALKEYAKGIIDIQTEMLIDRFGERQTKYKYYIGFQLTLSDNEFDMKTACLDLWSDFSAFLGKTRYQLAGDYLTMSRREVERYQAVERMLFGNISRRFKFKKVMPIDFGYIIEHLYGLDGVSYEDYNYVFPVKEEGDKIIVKKYDFLRITEGLIKEEPKGLVAYRDNKELYSTYFTIERIVSDLVFPNAEVLYYQQSDLDFPIDTSIKVEVVENRDALKSLYNKGQELKDVIKHAVKHDEDPSEEVLQADEDTRELEAQLKRSRTNMYKVSYLVRVWGNTREEFDKRCTELKDFYDIFDIKLVNPRGNMLDFQCEFIPTGKRAVNDYIQHVQSDFISGLGFGSLTKVGEDYGLYSGINLINDTPIYEQPHMAIQGIEGAITNSASAIISGATGWGKSMGVNNRLFWIALRGGRVVILDPKSERGGWKKAFPDIAHEINIINLESDESNQGLLDPFLILENVEESKTLALDILTYLLGVSVSDGDKMPLLISAVDEVARSDVKGMMGVIEKLREMEDEVAKKMATHIEGFTNYGFARLLFSDGIKSENTFDLTKAINIIQVADLSLPDRDTPEQEYTSIEKLSIASMLVISAIGMEFLYSDNSIFKVMAIDEAWAILSTSRGNALSNKGVRMGRSLNSGIYFITQGIDDVGNKDIRNNVGSKYAFHSDDIDEIKATLLSFGLDAEDEALQENIRNLGSGECLYRDPRGRISHMYNDLVFDEVYEGFDTTPQMKEGVKA